MATETYAAQEESDATPGASPVSRPTPETDSPLLLKTVFVGRTEVLDIAKRHLLEGRNVCLYGERGIGKTAVMEEIVRWLREQKPEVRFLHVVYQAPFTDVLLALVHELYKVGLFRSPPVAAEQMVNEDWEKVLQRVQALPLEQLHATVINSLKRERLLLVLDNVNNVNASDCLWLYEIIAATVCVVATRNPEATNVKPLLPSFTLVAVPPLSRRESGTLVDALTVDRPVPGGDRFRYQEQVYETSGGHPAAIRDMIWEDAQGLRESEAAPHPPAPHHLKAWLSSSLLKTWSPSSLLKTWSPSSLRPAAILALALLSFAIGFGASVLSRSDTSSPMPMDAEPELQEIRTRLQHLQTEHRRLNTAHAQVQQLTEKVATLGKKVEQLRFAFGRYARGSKGQAVERIQARLKELGYYGGEVTGDYDQTTKQAVRRFQDVKGLPINGVVNTETWDYLFPEKVAAREEVVSSQHGKASSQ